MQISANTFTLRKGIIPPIVLNNVTVSQTKTINLAPPRFKTHVETPYTDRTRSNLHKKKRRSKNSKLNVDNKLLIYKVIIKSIWTYGIELWSMAAKSYIAKVEALQSIIPRTIVNAPWYLRNDELRKALRIESVSEEIERLCAREKTYLENHPNDLARNLYATKFPKWLHKKHPKNLNNICCNYCTDAY